MNDLTVIIVIMLAYMITLLLRNAMLQHEIDELYTYITENNIHNMEDINDER